MSKNTQGSEKGLRIVYMGTPDFAVPALEELMASQDEVVGVVTNPDRPSGRGKKMAAPPVKRAAEAAGIEVYQPRRVRTDEAYDHIVARAPDVIVVAAFGQILPARLLQLPTHGCINIHASLLPKYRGAAPINWCIVRGEAETGVTIMQMDVGLDTGPMLMREATPIGAEETAQEVHDRLAAIGAGLIVETMTRIREGRLEATPQDDAQSTYAPMLSKEHGRIDWTAPARDVANLIRGFNPWPGTYALLEGKDGPQRIKFHRARAVAASGAPGQVLEADATTGRLIIACGEGAVSALELQVPGRKAMSAGALLRGFELAMGDQFLLSPTES
ncbi:MAG: methionyl-tRNA formyltransferase [Bradymonadaceae bacterium]